MMAVSHERNTIQETRKQGGRDGKRGKGAWFFFRGEKGGKEKKNETRRLITRAVSRSRNFAGFIRCSLGLSICLYITIGAVTMAWISM